jgi:hypothetical protein
MSDTPKRRDPGGEVSRPRELFETDEERRGRIREHLDTKSPGLLKMFKRRRLLELLDERKEE